MKKYTSILAATAFVIALTTACSSSPDTVDDQIHFGSDGNIYMPQSLCDEKDPTVSDEMKQKMRDWYADVKSGKITGTFICTK